MKILGMIISVLLLFSMMHNNSTYLSITNLESNEKLLANDDFPNSAFQSIVEMNDGGFALAGYTGLHQRQDMWLVRTDKDGTLLWEKTFGGNGEDAGNSMVKVNEVGYAITGYYYDLDTDSIGIWLVSTDSDGNQLWDKRFDYDEKSDWGASIAKVSDGGFIIAGYSDDPLLLRIDSDGNLLWNYTYGEPSTRYEAHRSAIEISTGGFMLAGWQVPLGPDGSSSSSNSDMWIVRADEDGNLIWNKTIGGNNIDRAESVIELTDGSFVAAGFTWEYDRYSIPNNAWLVCFDIEGNFIWNRTIEGGRANSLIKASNGDLIFTGETLNDAIWLVRTDENGNFLWEKTFSGDHGVSGYSVIEVSDGGFAIAGQTEFMCLLMRTDADGNQIWNKTYTHTEPIPLGYMVGVILIGGVSIVGLIALVIHFKRKQID